MLLDPRGEFVAGQDADITGTFLRPSLALSAGLTLRSRGKETIMHKTKKTYGILSYYCDYSSIVVIFFLVPVCFQDLLRPQKTSRAAG